MPFSQDAAKAKQFLPFLQRAGRSHAVVEYVASGSRLRLYIPRETCLITFLLAGRCHAVATNINLDFNRQNQKQNKYRYYYKYGYALCCSDCLYFPHRAIIIEKFTQSFLYLVGIECPRGSRPLPGGGTTVADPFGEEALLYTKEQVLQREVSHCSWI